MEEIREVLVDWGIQVLEKIEEVSIDLWLPYKNLVEELMPNANITADRFPDGATKMARIQIK